MKSVAVLCLVLAAAVTGTEAVNCLTQAGLNLILSSEGFSATFYNDAVGIKTIGYGTACHAYPCETLSPPITRQQGQDIMLTDIKNNYAPCVTSNVKVTISNNQFSALVSFVYNVGCNALKTSTLLKEVNANNFGAVPAQFLRWNKAGGQVLRGLTIRRQAEADMFASTGVSPCADGNVGNTNPNYGSCAQSGQSGTCKAVSECTGGSRAIPGLCNGPSYVQCCLPPPPNPNTGVSCTVTTNGNSLAGNCEIDTGCVAKGGTTTSGLCPGPANVKCCTFPAPTVYATCKVGQTNGQCVSVTQCSGSTTSGLCPGASTVQCCIPKPAASANTPTPTATPPQYVAGSGITTSGTCKTTATTGVPSQSGWCMNENSCPGGTSHTTAGLCPGSSAIKCCSYPACTLSTGTKGNCMPTSSCSGQGGLSTSGLCPGTSDIQCCTWPPGAASGSSPAASAGVCDIDSVNNCLEYGGTAGACYNNTGCVMPPTMSVSDTTASWSADGLIAHGNITEEDDSGDGLSGTTRRASGGVHAGLVVALAMCAAAAAVLRF